MKRYIAENERTNNMTAEQFIATVQSICQTAENCDMCVLNGVTKGICHIDKMDAEKLIEAIMKI